MWGALYPKMVERIVPFCGSAKTSRHNFVFLEGPKSALEADVAFAGGLYTAQLTKDSAHSAVYTRAGA